MVDQDDEDQIIDLQSNGSNDRDRDGREDNTSDMADDETLAKMKARVAEMEAEAEKLRMMSAGLDPASGGAGNSAEKQSTVASSNGDAGMASDEDPAIIDARSIYVGNVDYGATPEELHSHFGSCGTINRVTILCDRFTAHPKGYAYVEFASPDLVHNAVALNDSLFRGRQLAVTPKRTNVPGFNRGRGRGRGGGGYRGGFRGAPAYSPYARGGGYRGGRGRGRGW